jgi:RHS repeat-associated protein
VVSNCIYTYNGGQDLIGIDCKDALGVRQVGFSHVIDKAGNKLHEVKLHDLSRSHAYAHDGLHRLISYTEGTPDTQDPNAIPLPLRQQQWNLDKLGNWKTFTETTGGATTTQDRAHNKVNELRSITIGPAVTDFKYDAAGNLKDDTVFHYRYDEENRLKAVFISVVDPLTGNRVAGVAIARYKYDALGRRILKRLLNADGSTLLVTRFYYDGDRVVEERTGTQNLPSRQYIWGNYVDELLVNDPVDAFGNVVLANRLYALQNSTYSVHALVNDLGAVVERYDYTPYGEVTVLTSAGTPLAASLVGNVYTFTGRELDAESGLMHFRARAYSPKLGRFLQRDPAGFADGMNLYEYVLSRPSTWVDPFGTEGETTRRIVNIRDAVRRYSKAMEVWLAVAPPRGRDGSFLYPHPMGDPPALPKELQELTAPFDGIVVVVPPKRCSSCHGNPEVWFGLNTGNWDIEFLKRNPWAMDPNFVHAEEGTMIPFLSNLHIAATGRAPFGTTREFSDDERFLRTALFAVEISPLSIRAAQRVWTPSVPPGASAGPRPTGVPDVSARLLTPAESRALTESLEAVPGRSARSYQVGGVAEFKMPEALPAGTPATRRIYLKPDELTRFRAQLDELLGLKRVPALPDYSARAASVTLRSFDDIVNNPAGLVGKSADDVAAILGPGWTKGNYGVTGTGWKFTRGDKTVFYHVGGRHVGPYYGFSSGVTGRVKIVGPGYKPLAGDKATIITAPEE